MKALLIDDHPLILSALQAVIQGLGNHVEVVGVGSARAARGALVADPDFDLLLLDLHLGDANGFDLLVELRAAYPALPVVVVSASDRSDDVIRAIDLGAMGFVPKRASNATLHHALHTVMSGGIYVPPMTLTFDAEEPNGPAPFADTGTHTMTELTPLPTRSALGLRHRLAGARSARRGHFLPDARPGLHAGGAAPQSIAALGLTMRQNQVLTLLLQGQPNKLIARELNLSVETIKDHVASVMRILNVSSRTQAVLAVSQMGQQGLLPAWRETQVM